MWSNQPQKCMTGLFFLFFFFFLFLFLFLFFFVLLLLPCPHILNSFFNVRTNSEHFSKLTHSTYYPFFTPQATSFLVEQSTKMHSSFSRKPGLTQPRALPSGSKSTREASRSKESSYTSAGSDPSHLLTA